MSVMALVNGAIVMYLAASSDELPRVWSGADPIVHLWAPPALACIKGVFTGSPYGWECAEFLAALLSGASLTPIVFRSSLVPAPARYWTASVRGLRYAVAVVFCGALLFLPIRLLSPDGSTMGLRETAGVSLMMMVLFGSQALASRAVYWLPGGVILGIVNDLIARMTYDAASLRPTSDEDRP